MMPPMPPSMPPSNVAPRQPRLQDTEKVSCSACGSLVFKDGFLLRKASRLVTGEARDSLLTIPVMVCQNCGRVFDEILPEELKMPKTSKDV